MNFLTCLISKFISSPLAITYIRRLGERLSIKIGNGGRIHKIDTGFSGLGQEFGRKLAAFADRSHASPSEKKIKQK